MFFPLLLHFLPLFLLPYLLTLCKNNKKKKVQYKPSRRRAIRKKQKTSSTTTTDKLDSPLPEDEKKKREKIAKNEKKKKSQKMVKLQKKEKEKEEMSKNRKDSLLEEQAKTIRYGSRGHASLASHLSTLWIKNTNYSIPKVIQLISNRMPNRFETFYGKTTVVSGFSLVELKTRGI